MTPNSPAKKLPRPAKSLLNRVKIESDAPATPEPATPADNERSDPTFNISDENRRRRTRVVNKKSSDSVSISKWGGRSGGG